MKKFQLSYTSKNGIHVFEVPEIIDIDNYQNNIAYLADRNILTFGDSNTNLFAATLRTKGYTLSRQDLCADDDASIGLPIENTSYLNKGNHALSIPMYYNFLQYKELAKKDQLGVFNKKVIEEYGHVAGIEIYFQDQLLNELKDDAIQYFGTPRTLTECVRVLEGWNLQRVPRLKKYIQYANFIELWSIHNFPQYDESEWRLGETKSAALFQKKGTTNVREAVMFFWQRHLANKIPLVSPEDVEIDIVQSTFSAKRNPSFILLGEDIFDESVERVSEGDKKNYIKFKSFTAGKTDFFKRNTNKNGKEMKTALLAKEQFPDATVAVFKNPPGMTAFTMTKTDERKEGVDREVVAVASGLRFLVQNRFKDSYE